MPIPYIKQVAWSTTQANIGDTVQLTAKVENATPDTTLTFVVSEYSGRPPQEGGGWVEEEIDELPAELDPEAGEAKATWRVRLVSEASPHGEIPEYRFAARLVEDSAGVKSKLLKLGHVRTVEWVTAPDTPAPEGRKHPKFWLYPGRGIQARVEVEGLHGFQANLTFYKRITRPDRSVELEEIEQVKNIILLGSTVSFDWDLHHAQPHDASASELVFEATLSRGGQSFLPRDARSSVAGVILEPVLRDLNTNEAVLGPEVDPSQNIAWIQPGGAGGGPVMPKLEAQLKDMPANTRVFWRLETTFKRPLRRSRLEIDHVRLPVDGTFYEVPGDQPWKLHELYRHLPPEQAFFGGDAELVYKVGPYGKEQRAKFRILGKNPDNVTARSYIQGLAGPYLWFAHAIVRHEVGPYGNRGEAFPHFQGTNRQSRARIPGQPVWGLGDRRGPGGVGMMQVTGRGGDGQTDLPPVQLWNWQANVQAGLDILRGKKDAAVGYLATQRARMAQDQARLGLDPVSPPVVQYGNIVFQDDTAVTIEDAETIKRYNGGSFCKWKRAGVHTPGKWELSEASYQRVSDGQGGTTTLEVYYVRKVCEMYEQSTARVLID